MKWYLTTKISDIAKQQLLSPISYQIFNHLHIETMEDLKTYAEQRQKPFATYGPPCQQEALVLLKHLEPTQQTNRQTDPVTDYTQLSINERLIIDGCYNQTIKDNPSIALLYPSKASFHTALCCDTHTLLNFLTSCSFEENMRLRDNYITYLQLVESQLHQNGLDNTPLATTYQKQREELEAKRDYLPYAELYLSYLSDEQVKVIDHKNSQLNLALAHSNVDPHVRSALEEVECAAKLIHTPVNEYKTALQVDEISEDTLQHIQTYLAALKQTFDELIRQNDIQVRSNHLSLFYPLLSEEDIPFVKEFIKQHGHTPLLYVLYKYLQHATLLQTQIYAALHGLKDGQTRTNETLSQEMGLSPYTVSIFRHYLNDPAINALLRDYDWHHYSQLFEAPCLTAQQDLVQYYTEQEQLPKDFGITAWILRIPGNYTPKTLDKQTIAIKSNLCEEFNWRQCAAAFEAMVKQSPTTENTITLSNLMEQLGATTPTLDKPTRQAIAEVTQTIGREIYGLAVDSEGAFRETKPAQSQKSVNTLPPRKNSRKC